MATPSSPRRPGRPRDARAHGAQRAANPRVERAFVVSGELAGRPLDRTLRELLGGASWNQVRRTIETGKVRVDGAAALEPTRVVRDGARIEIVPNAPRPSAKDLPDANLIYVDAHVVVVEKPPHVSTVPYDEAERDTLDVLVERTLVRRERARRGPLGVVHRLDKETTGLLVFARTLAAKRHLKNQFRFHSTERRYWALVHGAMESGTLSSRLVPDRGDGLRGSTENPRLGRTSTTHVRVLERLHGATLVECRLETGRTHQIRIHLSEAGHSLVGERVYVPRGAVWPVVAPRVMLHAFELGFEHPTTGEPLHFESPMPEDMNRVLAALRRR